MPATTPISPRPNGLLAQAQNQADAEHNRRTAELKALAPLLAQLDPFMPGLRAAGLDLNPDNIGLRHEHIGPRRLRVLRLMTGGVFGDIKRICGWLQELKALGFQEISRDDSAYPTALLRRQHLLLRVDVLRTPPAAQRLPDHGTAVRQAIAEAQANATTTEHAA